MVDHQDMEQPDKQYAADRPVLTPHWGFQAYFWFLIKNVLGWVLLLGSFVLGPFVPGPGGIPLFLIGFALITFPGKRRFTARILRGRPVDPNSRVYRTAVVVIALLVPAALILWLAPAWSWLHEGAFRPLVAALAYLAAVAAIWIFGLHGVRFINWTLSAVSRTRRRIRPWMRHRGLDLLPPRRRRRLRHHGVHSEPDEEILEIHERHQHRFRYAWTVTKPWTVRAFRVLFVAGVFWLMLRPVARQWDDPAVQERIAAINWWHFVLAAAMFSVFLFVFRALVWRHILRGLGHCLPIPAATRIWSMSELARYLPGVIWQVVGRVYLSRPYGVSSSISSASQILELILFLLANILVALTCLLAGGLRLIPADQRHWLFVAMGFAPVLLVLLHPRIFYRLLNRALRRLGKPEIARRLPKRVLSLLLGWNILGLLWQSLAIWILTSSSLGLPLGKWYLLAGAYCLAWTMGFSVGFLSPGGMGVREFVFVTTLQFMIPGRWAMEHFPDPHVLPAVAGFLGVLLRLWAIAGEILMAFIAYLADYRGAMGHPDAPGRAPMPASAGEAE